MRTAVKRWGVVALVLAAVAVLHVQNASAALACSAYITSQSYDEPLWGWLIGESTTSSTTSWSVGGGWSARIFGGSYSASGSTTTSYNIGTYQMSDGNIRHLRCDSYRTVQI